jgi:hypothetical protein
MASNESAAFEIMQGLDLNYVPVIFGGLSGYSSDDINKFLWMVRIGGGVFPDHIKEKDYLADVRRGGGRDMFAMDNAPFRPYSKSKLVSLFVIARIRKKCRSTRFERSSKAPVL